MTTSVARIKPHLHNISAPDALRGFPAWLIWRYEHHEGEEKPRKVPYYTSGGRRVGVQGRPEDVASLTTFEAARSAAARMGFDGVGFCPLPQWGITALDFDRCMADGGVHPDVERLVSGTYAEFSPSGQGVRAFFRGYLGNEKDHGGPWGFEVFSTKGFVTFTGNALDLCEMLGTENTVSEIPAEVHEECRRRFGTGRTSSQDDDPLMSYEPPLGLTTSQILEALDVLPNDLPYEAGRGDPSWLAVGMAIHHETNGEGFELWDEWSKRSPKYSSEKYGRDKWKSFGKPGARPVTARGLVRWANANGAHITTSVASTEKFDAAVESKGTKPLRFPVLNADQFATGRPPGWIIKGLLPRAELCVLFGEPGSGKSFLALDIAAAIVRGVEWRGLRTKQGRVVYVAAEGSGGFRNRLNAYKASKGVDLGACGLGVIAAAPNLMQLDDVAEMVRAIQEFGGCDVIVVDTFAQATPGANENAGEDMGKALAHCKRLHRATGALVILVHHSGKDAAKGSRGWSGIKGAADAEIEVTRAGLGRKVRVSKQKDGADGLEWGFDLEVVAIGQDEDGDVIDSCVVIETAVPQGVSQRKLGKLERVVVEVVSEMAQAQSEGIEIEAVLKESLARVPKPEGRDARRQHLRRAIEKLSEGEDAPWMIDGDCLSMLV